jgi:YggT family protein
MLTWFGGMQFGKPMAVLSAITDPYLDWFRRFPALQVAGFLDLSPIVAMAVLSVLNSIFMMIAQYGYISLGIVLSIVLSAIWSAAAFILGFIAIVLVLRLFAYLTSQNTFGPFWRIIDAISRPILYRINRMFFRNRLVNYKTEIITSLVVCVGLWVGIGILVKVAGYFLVRLPI